jgi:membrane protease YdiL (CAAX protease family)
VIELAQLDDRGSLAELEAAMAGVRGRAFWLALLGLGLAPGVAEELLCRGLVQRGLAPSVGGVAAVALAALFFGAMHVDPVHAGFAAVLGLYLGFVSHLAGSVRPAIACHAVNNLCAVLASSLAPDLAVPPALSIGLGGGFAVAALAWVWRTLPPEWEDSRHAASDGVRQLRSTDRSGIGRL